MANGTLAASQIEMLSQSGTGITTLVPPATNTNRTINLPDSNGTILTTATAGVPINGPAFSATRNGAGNQTVSAATYTKVLFPTEEFDTNSCFASSTFTPTVAGYYQLNAAVGLNSTGESLIQVYKNGSNFKTGQDIVGTIYNLAFSTLVYANGSTDYFEVYAYPGAGTTFSGSSGVTYFQASMVRAA